MNEKPLPIWFVTSAILTVLALITGICVGLVFLVGAVSRYQHRADAANSVKVSAIQIRNQKQRVQIAKQKAEILPGFTWYPSRAG